MATCIKPELSPSYCYKKFKCRCDRCLDWKLQANKTNDKALAAERSRLWRLQNPERSRENAISYQQRNPHQVHKWALKKYNLTVEEYNNLLTTQENVCAICKQPCKYKKRLSVDHSHTTGKVRGLLCGNCNTGIGKLKESKEIMLAAIKYVEENGDVY